MYQPARDASSPRVLARTVTDFLIDQAARWRAALGQDRLSTLVRQAVLTANLMHLPYRAADRAALPAWHGLDVPDALRRPISIASIATSMNLPGETVRRRAHDLGKAGLLECGRNGCLVRQAHVLASPLPAVMEGEKRALLACLHELAGHGLRTPRAAIAGAAAAPATVVSRLTVELAIRVLDPYVARYGDLLSGTVATGVTAANTRHLRSDPELARRYAALDEPPPDALRRPISVRQLAREMELPFETVRRRVAMLLARGELEAVDGGYIVPARLLSGERYRAQNAELMRPWERLTTELARFAETRPG